MTEELIQLPELKDIKEMLELARQDINTEVEQDPDMASSSKLLVTVIDIINEKLVIEKDLSNLDLKKKIDLAAHLNFLHCLLDDFASFDEEEFDEDEDEDEYKDEDEDEGVK